MVYNARAIALYRCVAEHEGPTAVCGTLPSWRTARSRYRTGAYCADVIEYATLTNREEEVLQFTAAGFTNQEIAE